MCQSIHIHIRGLVQGVGFRPFVCRLAIDMNLKGWVSNTNDGLHIEITGDEKKLQQFLHRVIHHSPSNAIIADYQVYNIDTKEYPGFSIRHSTAETEPNLLLTPDIALCEQCKQEITNASNKRHHYAFTTCLNCGPRYSITTALPYDREHTTMADLKICDSCKSEYNDIDNRRHYSQTNSCKDCAIQLHLYNSKNTIHELADDAMIDQVVRSLNEGKIVAVKGMSGFLLLCDAGNEEVIRTLRLRKQRPAKPFALLYADTDMAEKDAVIHYYEKSALKSKAAPIVLCRRRKSSENNICSAQIAPGLERIGVMLPSTPLLFIIMKKMGKPVIATSGNISGSPVLYNDEDALNNLFEEADLILTYDREIVAPQDDSVLQFTKTGQRIILRRSRGLAPNYYPNPFKENNERVLATGGELKAAFALLNKNNLYISQYLGDQGSADAQQVYTHTLDSFTHLMQAKVEKIIIDKHPAYAVASLGTAYAEKNNIDSPVTIQHHKAHFAAVLAENNLLHTARPILGFAWDGTGYGDDEQVWGSETFLFLDGKMKRVAHLAYFPVLLGDKMSKEPRLAALSLLQRFHGDQFIIRPWFNDTEWQYYQKLINSEHALFTSSMGRFLDGIACILGIKAINTYEGEAAMQLEAMALKCTVKPEEYYPLPLLNGILDWSVFLTELLADLLHNKEVTVIAWKVFNSLARCIGMVSNQLGINHIAFSGGVFQNALLNELIVGQMSHQKKLYFHKQLSPNDECIGFGQLACYELLLNNSKAKIQKSKNLQPFT